MKPFSRSLLPAGNLLFLPTAFSVCVCMSCKKNMLPFTQDGNWVSESTFNGQNRSDAVTFTIGNFAYLYGGWDGGSVEFNDLWQFDPSGIGNWSQLADMPNVDIKGAATARRSAIAFTIGQEGYVGTGYDGYNYRSDFWQYDPPSNTWTQKADFPGSARDEAVGFAIGNYGYLSTGYDGLNDQKDFWQYDPLQDSWTIKQSMGGDKRHSAVAFVRENKGYIVTGVNSGTAVNDFWRYDPAQPDSSSWTELNHIANISTASFDDGYINMVRWNASAFVILGADTSADRAFVSTGENGALNSFTWEYFFSKDLWQEKTPFQGIPRTGAVGITVRNRGYIGLGRSSTQALDDLYEFQPDVVENPNQ